MSTRKASGMLERETGILTETTPTTTTTARIIVPSWATLGPLITRFRLSVTPHHDGTWDVHAPAGTPYARRRVWLRDLRAAIAAVAQQCAADAAEKGEG